MNLQRVLSEPSAPVEYGVEIASAKKSFASTAVLPGTTLRVRHGEFVALLGPSGCGKTTLLRLVAGFEKLDSGRISIDGRVVSGKRIHVPPEQRNIGIVFQSFALWPHMSVSENVGYSLKIAGRPTRERKSRVSDALGTVNLGGLEERRPADLSGGQRQRVALARCLVAEPDVILLDEPLANLDVHLRTAMEAEFGRFHRQAGATTLYVTHDQSEAMALADRVAVMEEGRIVQFASPEQLYDEPATDFVARFVGNGRLFPIEEVRPTVPGYAEARLFGVPLSFRAGPKEHRRDKALVCLRSRALRFSPDSDEGIPARVTRHAYRGGFWHVEVRLDASPQEPVLVNAESLAGLTVGNHVKVVPEDAWIIPPSGQDAEDSPIEKDMQGQHPLPQKKHTLVRRS
jgi:iron(III) transport system ATP-binding protein